MLGKILKFLLLIVIIGVGLFLFIQLIPYGKDHNNPPVVSEPKWDNQQTRQLARTACFDCHSNETVWPWYSNIAPVSWLVYRDVAEGRQKLNFSDWQNSNIRDVDEIASVINEGEMPPFQYLPTHPAARLSTAEKSQLINGLTSTLDR